MNACTNCGKQLYLSSPEANIWYCRPSCGLAHYIPPGQKLNALEINALNRTDEEKAAMRAFVKSEGSCLVLAGSVGCGKTYAANAIIQDFHHPGLLVNIPELYVSWKDAAREPHAEKALLKKSTSTPLVVFDDLGNRTPTDAFADFLYVIINERWSKKLHTVITTNISSKEIRARFGDAIASRILCGKAIKFADGDRRLDLNAF